MRTVWHTERTLGKKWGAGLVLPSLGTHPRSLGPMINLARIHAYKSGEFSLFDVARIDLNKMKEYLISSGFIISHVEYV